MDSDKFKKQIESMWKHRDTDEQKRLVKFTIAKTMRLTLEYPELAQEYFDSLCKVIPDNERITISNYQHNLTSDAEEEEMLTVSRTRVQRRYHMAYECKHSGLLSHDDVQFWKGWQGALDDLFGSKCLPDEPPLKITAAEDCIAMAKEEMGIKDEPKPAEPKYHKDDKVLYNGAVHKITVGYGDGRYLLNNAEKVVKESDLEPYTEPEEVAKMRPIESKVSVYLATKEEDEEFRLLLYKNGFKWNTNTPLINLKCWSPASVEEKIHYVHPDKTVTYYGEKTSETLTFSEFKKRYFGEQSRNLSRNIANCDKYHTPDSWKMFDNILKNSFSKERRLAIAAQMMQGLICAPLVPGITPNPPAEYLAQKAFRLADALIAEAEK